MIYLVHWIAESAAKSSPAESRWQIGAMKSATHNKHG